VRVAQAPAHGVIRPAPTGLPRVVVEPTDVAAREQTLYGAYLAAVAFASAVSVLHNRICHVLGGMFGLPHAETHAVVITHVLALNAPAVPDLESRMAAAFRSTTALSGLVTLRDEVDAPRALRDLGMTEAQIPSAVRPIVEASPSNNPTPVTTENIEA